MPLSLPLSRSQLDRAAHLRSDQGALDEFWAKGKIIDLLGDRFRIDGTKLALLTSAQVDELEKQSAEIERYFLGLDSNQVAYFVAHRGDAPSEYPSGYESLRTIGKSLSDLEIGAAVHALALSLWHQSHRRCAKCGAETKSTLGGSVRKCLSCEADHHPRTDPAVIVLVKDKSDRILLGRQRVWPPKRFSTFAGFVEPGESFERTVIREVAEECGGSVESMRYLGSQPWPFPASLMIAFEATITNPDSVKADGEEIEEIIWLDRDSLKSKNQSEELLLPPKISVARAMIESWYGNSADVDLSGKEAWRN
ncbi:MAG: NAD(+) diphosphatase [Actinobacteria bacterium]|nr:NAD(+) diphosphatase [Actinomycetota bacterium]